MNDGFAGWIGRMAMRWVAHRSTRAGGKLELVVDAHARRTAVQSDEITQDSRA